MSGQLSRTRPAPPVRLVHLGLGNFFRAHQAFYTEQSSDGQEWGIAAFAGRSAGLAQALEAQGGLYTLVTRAAGGDRFDIVESVARAHAGDDHEAWLGYLASPDVRAVTLTVTEAGYVRGAGGGLDATREDVVTDIAALRRDPSAEVRTAPARLVAGLAARRRADAGPLTVVPCDNLPENGRVVARVVSDLAESVDPGLAEWIASSVSTVTTMVDRITPRASDADMAAIAAATGVHDATPVVTEPFHEWVLSGEFVAGRPRWEDAGAVFTPDIGPFEDRKLWLLNGAHSLLAYAGSIRGSVTVAEAMRDGTVRRWLEQWWNEATPHVDLPAADLSAYRAALVERFANPRMHHLLAQIAADGSQKLPIRVLPTVRAERAAGRVPAGATLALAAWTCHLRGVGIPINDVRAAEFVPLAAGPLPEAVKRVLGALHSPLAADAELVAAVVEGAGRLEAYSG